MAIIVALSTWHPTVIVVQCNSYHHILMQGKVGKPGYDGLDGFPGFPVRHIHVSNIL